MKILVVYDSQYGNTEKIAKAIGQSLSDANVIKAADVSVKDIEGIDMLIVGSPTQGGRPTLPIQEFLKNIPSNALKNVKTAAFDTGFHPKDLNFALKLLVKTIGYAAPKIAGILRSKGGILIQPPETFIVTGTSGPLAEGELNRAKAWIKTKQ